MAGVDSNLPLDMRILLQPLKDDVQPTWADIVDSNASVEKVGKMVVAYFALDVGVQIVKTCCLRCYKQCY